MEKLPFHRSSDQMEIFQGLCSSENSTFIADILAQIPITLILCAVYDWTRYGISTFLFHKTNAMPRPPTMPRINITMAVAAKEPD